MERGFSREPQCSRIESWRDTDGWSDDVIYRRGRNLYWRLAKRDLHRATSDLRTRLGEYVSEGDLVFDVGANVGDIISFFLDIGVRVVAVEPNPELASVIRKRHSVTVRVCCPRI